MGTVADKLDKLLSTKADIKAAIIEKGQAVADADTFASYADKIRAIQTGINTSDATATAADIVKDKTAYVDGKKVVGTLVKPPPFLTITIENTTDTVVLLRYLNDTGGVTSNSVRAKTTKKCYTFNQSFMHIKKVDEQALAVETSVTNNGILETLPYSILAKCVVDGTFTIT